MGAGQLEGVLAVLVKTASRRLRNPEFPKRKGENAKGFHPGSNISQGKELWKSQWDLG